MESSYLNNQGYDEALWTPYNQVPSLYVEPVERNGGIVPTSMSPELFPKDIYDMDKGWRPKGFVWALEGVKGGPVREWGRAPNIEDYMKLDAECETRLSAFMRKSIAAKKPFYAAYWPQITPFGGFPEKVTVCAGMPQEGIARLDIYVGKLMKELEELGVAENTLVVMMADKLREGPRPN